MKMAFRALSACFSVFIFLACASIKEDKNQLINPLAIKVNQGIFYILEGKIAGKTEPLYMSIKKQAEGNFSLSAVFLNNNEIYFEGDIKDNNFSFIFNELNYNKSPIVVDLSFDELNHPKIIAQYKGTLDGLVVIYELSKQKLNNLEFIVSSESMTKKDSKGINYKSSLSDELFLIPANSQLDQNIKEKINKVIALSSSNLNELEQRLKKVELQTLKDLKEPSFYAEYYNSIIPYYVDENILVFTHLNYEYLSGAHGNSVLMPQIFSLQTGEILSAKSEDLFKDTKDTQLLSLLLQGLRSYDDKSFFKDQTGISRFLNWDGVQKDYIALPDVFFISNKGVEFIFAPYEIASYAEGFIRIRIPFKELKPFVKDSSPFAYFFK